MIKFVDIENGNVFDGGQPYVHYFGDGQSINLNYSKVLCVVSDKETISYSLDSEVFFLVNIAKLVPGKKIRFSLKDFEDLENLTYDTVDDVKTKITSLTSTGTKAGNVYVHLIYLIAKGLYIGEVTDEITIDGQKFTLGADFYDENESLGISLANFGMELSNEIQRAIYEKNIHEQKVDYILINRKYKELLNEYINIIANKGSYKSLINSKNWFEYGDLVKINEYWRHGEPNRPYLNKRSIEQYLTNEIETQLSGFQKTTYISLNCALNDIEKLNGDIVYAHEDLPSTVKNEPVPGIEEIATLWTRDEMSLKMVLLGNFFATYFMPIHLDLLKSTIEDVIFASTIKIRTWTQHDRFDNMDNILRMDVEYEKTHQLSIVEHSETTGLFSDGTDYFKSIAALIQVSCYLYGIDEDYTLEKGRIILYKKVDDELEYQWTREDYNVPHKPSLDQETQEIIVPHQVDFDFLVQKDGSYQLKIEFERVDGYLYTKTIYFDVYGENQQTIKPYKLVYNGTEEINIKGKQNLPVQPFLTNWIGETGIPFDNYPEYAFSPVIDPNLKMYRQFIASNMSVIDKKVHFHQVQIIKYPVGGGDLYVNYKVTSSSNIGTIKINDIINVFKTPYFYYVTEKRRSLDENDDTTDGYLVLIDKHYVGEKDTSGNVHTHVVDFYTNNSSITVWNRDCFVPYFYSLEELDGYTIEQDDVICFLPEYKLIKQPEEAMWKFINKTTDEEITPIIWRKGDDTATNDITITEPLFGRYDFAILPKPGYYDVELRYKLSDDLEDNEKIISSMFLVSK